MGYTSTFHKPIGVKPKYPVAVKPSQAAIDATRKLRAEGFNPLKALKERNPRKYKELMKRRSEARKELIKKERRRLLFGLEQKTSLHVTLSPLSHRASAQKYAMIRENNYFSVPDHTSWVCYDSRTRRSARREKTAIRHGLRIVAGEE